jgi:hypothetical protein
MMPRARCLRALVTFINYLCFGIPLISACRVGHRADRELYFRRTHVFAAFGFAKSLLLDYNEPISAGISFSSRLEAAPTRCSAIVGAASSRDKQQL